MPEKHGLAALRPIAYSCKSNFIALPLETTMIRELPSVPRCIYFIVRQPSAYTMMLRLLAYFRSALYDGQLQISLTNPVRAVWRGASPSHRSEFVVFFRVSVRFASLSRIAGVRDILFFLFYSNSRVAICFVPFSFLLKHMLIKLSLIFVHTPDAIISKFYLYAGSRSFENFMTYLTLHIRFMKMEKI